MKYITKFGLFMAVLVMAISFADSAKAQYYYYGNTPTLSVNREGSGDSVRINVSGAQSYSPITLYRRQGTSLWTTITNFGQTDQSGYFSSLQSLGADNSNNPVEMYVVVGGQQSSTVQVYPWGYGGGCTYNCEIPYGLSLSQNSVTVNTGNYAYVTASNYASGLYVSGNSNSNIASVSVSGSQVSVYGLSAGNTTATVCANNGNCASIYITVNGQGGTGNIWFSPSSPSLNIGQSLAVSINSNYTTGSYSYNNSYYIASNSNSGAVSASVSGTVLNLYGLQNGTSNISVCHSSLNFCGNVYVTVSGSNSNYGNIWFSPSGLNLTSGQSSNINIYSSSGYGGSYYISSNSNSYIAAANISGSALSVTAYNPGSSTITVCQSSSSVCGNVTVNVTGGNWNISLTFSQNNVNLSGGQNASITIYGNGSYYISSNSNSSVATASVSGNVLNVYANSFGNTAVIVCQNNPYACGTVMVNVTSYNSGGNLSFASGNLPVMVLNQYYNYQIVVYGGSSPYTFYLSSGQLPQGLSLSSSGYLYGTPYSGQNSSFTVRVQDTQGRTAFQTFNITGTGGVLGGQQYANGQLIKENGTVYIVYRNSKSGFANSSAFTGFGFKFSNVLDTGYTGLASTGFTITTSNASHPWGSWVKSGQTIYFVHQHGLIPVPSWEVFVNNGGRGEWVVPANWHDMARPILNNMIWNDNRLY